MSRKRVDLKKILGDGDRLGLVVVGGVGAGQHQIGLAALERLLHVESGQKGRLVETRLEEGLPQTGIRFVEEKFDRGLGPVELHRRPREASFGRNLQKHAQFAQFHVGQRLTPE